MPKQFLLIMGEKETNVKNIQIKMSEAQHQSIKLAAVKAGLSVSAYVRMMAIIASARSEAE